MIVRSILILVLHALVIVPQQISGERYRIWSSVRGTWARAYSFEGVPETFVNVKPDIADPRDNEIWEIEPNRTSKIVNVGTKRAAQPWSHDSRTIVTASYSVKTKWDVLRVQVENREDMYRITLDGTNLVWTQVRGSIILWDLVDDEIDWDQLWYLEPIRNDDQPAWFKGQ